MDWTKKIGLDLGFGPPSLGLPSPALGLHPSLVMEWVVNILVSRFWVEIRLLHTQRAKKMIILYLEAQILANFGG